MGMYSQTDNTEKPQIPMNNYKQQSSPEKNKAIQKDFMIFKFTDNKTRILNEFEMHNEFNRRENDTFW